MKLYVIPGACSLASHIALVWAGASYEITVLGHADVGGDAYRRINPKAHPFQGVCLLPNLGAWARDRMGAGRFGLRFWSGSSGTRRRA